ncbi:hypothetical protein [Streptomyces parvulus]|uniref:hypothetical protein n=1 Tax=Streptomyces parvulus TaxID=146923 RepID=UPI0033A74872
MTAHRRPLPSLAEVRAICDALAAKTGRTPSVLALATQLGLANTTFRRNFPQVCDELAGAARTPGANGSDAYSALKADNARLRRAKRDLTAQLELAIAAIQRLTIDNERLRGALHDASVVSTLPRRGQR